MGRTVVERASEKMETCGVGCDARLLADTVYTVYLENRAVYFAGPAGLRIVAFAQRQPRTEYVPSTMTGPFGNSCGNFVSRVC